MALTPVTDGLGDHKPGLEGEPFWVGLRGYVPLFQTELTFIMLSGRLGPADSAYVKSG